MGPQRGRETLDRSIKTRDVVSSLLSSVSNSGGSMYSYEELEEEKREMRCIYKTRGDVKVYLEPCKTILDWPKSGKQGGDIK